MKIKYLNRTATSLFVRENRYSSKLSDPFPIRCSASFLRIRKLQILYLIWMDAIESFRDPCRNKGFH